MSEGTVNPEPSVARGMLPVANVAPSPTNPRKGLDATALDELTQSVRKLGVPTPTGGRSASGAIAGGGWRLWRGRRLTAACSGRTLGLRSVPLPAIRAQ